MKSPRVYKRLPAGTIQQLGFILRGLCDNEDGILWINPDQSDHDFLVTAIHEALHYTNPKRTERMVERDGEIIGNVVWRLGYRRPKSKQ